MTDRRDDRQSLMDGEDTKLLTAPSPASEGSDPSHALRCRTVATSGLGLRHHIRDLEPIGAMLGGEAGGTLLAADREPRPTEMLLAALGACLTTSIQANAVARNIPLRSLEVHTGGDVDPSTLWRTGERRVRAPGFGPIAVTVHVEADVPADALKALVDHAVLWSPVANTLHDPLHIDVAVAGKHVGDAVDAA